MVMAKFKEDSIDPSFPVAPPSGKPCPASKMIVWFVTGSEFTSIVVGEIDVEKIEINIENDIKRNQFLFKNIIKYFSFRKYMIKTFFYEIKKV